MGQAPGDAEQNQQFWKAFRTSAKLRNDAVHAGRRVTEAEANASVKAAAAFVRHVTSIAATIRKQSA